MTVVYLEWKAPPCSKASCNMFSVQDKKDEHTLGGKKKKKSLRRNGFNLERKSHKPTKDEENETDDLKIET